MSRAWYSSASLFPIITAFALASGFLLARWVFPAPVQAQQTVTLASLQISIWPEFDRPSSLVILDGKLASSVTLPVDLTVRIPAAARTPNAVAVAAPDGSLLQAAYTTAAADGDIIVKFTSNSAVFRVEYYDPALVINGDARSFTFRWKCDFAVAAVGLMVQEPYGAQKLAGKPALAPAGTGLYGLNYDAASLGALPAGGTVSLDLTYTKSGSTLSATAVGPTQSAAAAPASNPTQSGGSLYWILGAAGVGLLVVGGGALWYSRRTPVPRPRRLVSQSRRRRAEPVRPRPAAGKPAAPVAAAMGARSGVPAAAAKEPASATLAEAPAGFCVNCGQRQLAGDQFCRQCGTPVRE